jgi:hypothetical protein
MSSGTEAMQNLKDTRNSTGVAGVMPHIVFVAAAVTAVLSPRRIQIAFEYMLAASLGAAVVYVL